MPRFTADASLYTSSRTYQGAVSPGRSGAIIQLAVDFPFFDLYNRCGCWDAYRDCLYICYQTDDPRCDALGNCPCQYDCRTSLADCYAYCNYRRLTLPPSVVRPLGR
jgi:hypothetical protein